MYSLVNVIIKVFSRDLIKILIDIFEIVKLSNDISVIITRIVLLTYPGGR